MDEITATRNIITSSIRGIWIILLIATMNSGCKDQLKSTSKNCHLSGTYYWTDGYQNFELNVMGDSWFGQLIDNTTSNILMNGAGHVDGKNLIGEYGTEMGYQTRNCDITFQGFTGYFILEKQ